MRIRATHAEAMGMAGAGASWHACSPTPSATNAFAVVATKQRSLVIDGTERSKGLGGPPTG